MYDTITRSRAEYIAPRVAPGLDLGHRIEIRAWTMIFLFGQTVLIKLLIVVFVLGSGGNNHSVFDQGVRFERHPRSQGDTYSTGMRIHTG